ncbi:unnamed protein product, partial [marine sediment metagenome]
TVIATESSLCKLITLKKNVTFQLFGVDVIFDKKLNPYLLEMNKGPDMIPKNNLDKKLKQKVTNDIFRLVDVTKKDKKNGFVKIYG